MHLASWKIMNRKPVISCCHLADFLHSPLSASPTDPSKDKFSRRKTKSMSRFLERGLYESRKAEMQLMREKHKADFGADCKSMQQI